MTDSEYIGYRLKSDATITALVGTGTAARIYHGFIPETIVTYPMINYFLVNYQNFDHRMDRVHYQISVRSKNPEQAKNLAYAIECLFATKQETVNNFDVNRIWWDQTNLLMEGKDVYHFSVDIYINFRHS